MKEDLKPLCEAKDFKEFIDLFVKHFEAADGDESDINGLKEEAVGVLNDIVEEQKDEAVSEYREDVWNALGRI
jgi:hypothetical protein